MLSPVHGTACAYAPLLGNQVSDQRHGRPGLLHAVKELVPDITEDQAKSLSAIQSMVRSARIVMTRPDFIHYPGVSANKRGHVGTTTDREWFAWLIAVSNPVTWHDC
jgi:hypothetical protein